MRASRPPPRAASLSRPVATAILACVVCQLALIGAVWLLTNAAQQKLQIAAQELYDRTFLTVTGVGRARSAFEHLIIQHADLPNPSADPMWRDDLMPVLDQIDLLIAMAGTPGSRGHALAMRAELLALARPGGNLAPRAVAADISQRFSALAAEETRHTRQERDRLDARVAQDRLLLLASPGVSASFVILVGLLVAHLLRQRQLSLARLAHLSRHDPLTDLPNHAGFDDALTQAAARAGRGEAFAVLCLDLDHFKGINETLGHPVGDALLREVAARLRAETREVDRIARLGGDEFAILQASIKSPEEVASLGRRIVAALSAPYDVAGHRLIVGASLGIALASEASRDKQALLRNARLALVRAKQEEPGSARFFEAEMDARAQARRALEVDLRAALQREEFELFYQPLIAVADRRIAAFEALIRWNHPVRGLVLPGEFIPLAEEIGLIVPIGAWVLDHACRQAASWPDPVGVAVNLSAIQFARSDILAQVKAALRDSGLKPGRLELEITESILLRDTGATLAVLHDLRALGVRISMDDFGTGYSSLSYLRCFPFDKLKIDQSFVRDLGTTKESLVIVRAIAGMGSSLGITTTAEGVETQTQINHLIDEGCSELQGYFFSPPRSASEARHMLSESAARQAVFG